MENSIIDFSQQIAQELNLSAFHVANVIRLLNEGATIPFIARYRKEMTGTMDEEKVAAVDIDRKRISLSMRNIPSKN